MIKKYCSIPVITEVIACNILSKNDLDIPPRFVFLHGAGDSVKERVHSIAPPIINNRINILTFDFSGHGESTGELKKSNLAKRVNEAKEVINQFAANEPLIMCGSSMGGFIAIKLLEFYKVDTLILFCPALYDKEAYAVQFDAGFTNIIRAPESWRKTDTLNLLESFTGNLLIVMGEKDEVIPPGVIELIIHHTAHAKKQELYIIPNCPHRINTWIIDQAVERAKLHAKISEYITFHQQHNDN